MKNKCLIGLLLGFVFIFMFHGSAQAACGNTELQLSTNSTPLQAAAIGNFTVLAATSTSQKPAAPSNVKAKATSYNKIKVSWKKVSNAKKYIVYRSTKKNSGYKKIGTTTKKSYTDKNVSLGTTYYYKVVAKKGSLKSSKSEAVKAKSAPASPKKVKVSVSGRKVKITWKASTGAKKYIVYRATSKNGTYKKIKTVNSTTYTDKKRTIGKTYYYKIKAVQNSVKSTYSSVKKAKIKPNAVSKLKVSANSSDNAVLKWSKVSKAASYYVYRSTSKNSGFKKIAEVTKRKYTDKSLAEGKTYYYRIYAVKNKLKSSYKSISYTTAKKVKLSKSSVSLVKGKTVTLKATVLPSKTTDKSVSWSTSNKSVAKVNSSGKVTAVGAGTATITVKTLNGNKRTCKVTVKRKQPSEMKAVWISYLDIQESLKDKNKSDFKKQANSMFESIKNKGLNTVIIQVRAFSDAIYPSSYYSWASYITSNSGGPGYDPLEILVDAAHDNDLSIQAWINPYRTSSAGVANPGSSSVINKIVNGVAEIVKNYNVDGIHFDDYFYASTDTTSQSTKMKNVNKMVKKVYAKIKSIDSNVVFGISPQGNMDNAKAVGCDIDTWLSKSGYIDYICPQLYWSDNYVTSSGTTKMFTERLNQWVAANKGNKTMYIGLALYKAGTSSSSTWGTDAGWGNSTSNLTSQYSKAISVGADGYAVFRYDYLFTSAGKKEMANLKNVSK